MIIKFETNISESNVKIIELHNNIEKFINYLSKIYQLFLKMFKLSFNIQFFKYLKFLNTLNIENYKY